MASLIVVKIVGAVFKLPLASMLGETGSGYFNSAYTIFNTVYSCTVTGLSAGVARMVAENVAKGRYRDVKRIFRIATMVFLVVGLLGFLIMALAARGLANLMHSPNAFWAIIMLSPAIFFCCLMASYRGYYEGLSNMMPTAVTQVVEVMTKLVMGLLFANLVMNAAAKEFAASGTVFGTACESAEMASVLAAPFGAAGAVLGVTISTLIGFIYIFLRYKIKGDAITKAMVKNSPNCKRGKVLLYHLIKIAIPITLSSVIVQLSTLIDVFTIQGRLASAISSSPELMNGLYGSYLMESELMPEFLYGVFANCVNLFNLVPAFTNIFGKSALPNVTSAWTMKDRRLLKLNVESTIRMTALIAAPMAFGISFMAKPILSVIYPNLTRTIALGPHLLSILGIGALFLAVIGPINAIMQGIGRMDLPVKYMCAGICVKIVLNVILVGIPSINILGGTISTLCCYALIAFLSVNKLRNIITVSLDYKSIFLKPIISGLICGIAAFLSYNALTNIKVNSIITIVSIGIGGLFYILSLALLNAISRDDINMLPKGNKIAKVLEKLHIIR